MDKRTVLLNQIVRDPYDDAPRLEFATWLGEGLKTSAYANGKSSLSDHKNLLLFQRIDPDPLARLKCRLGGRHPRGSLVQGHRMNR